MYQDDCYRLLPGFNLGEGCVSCALKEKIMDTSSAPWDPAFEKLVLGYLFPVPAKPLAPDLSLRASGLDSYSALGLLAAIEDMYGLRIPVDLLTFEMFETPAVLWTTIKKARELRAIREHRAAGESPTPTLTALGGAVSRTEKPA
jgi:acyl carrier protein